MRRFFDSPYFKALVGIVLVALAAVLVWFVGPLVFVGAAQPLKNPEVRVATIIVLCFFILFFLLRWPLYLLVAFVLCMLVWYMGPAIALGQSHPVESVAARVLGIVLIVLVALGYAAYQFWQLLRNDQDFVKKVFSARKDAREDLAKEEIKTLDEATKRALGQLRKMHATKGLKGLLDGKQFLYELPWYMLIGSPGAGKTTALLNSGLTFPIADQMGAASTQLALAHNAGTINCNWWFTNEAVMIDTAGRYTHQSDGLSAHLPAAGTADDGISETAISADVSKSHNTNAAEWLGFLGILRKYRARAPLNGVLLVLDVAELLRSNAQERLLHAAQIKSRLLELREHLHIRFPVYVLVTKMDLLRGFNEYFYALTSEGRSQILGFTLPLELTTAANAQAGAMTTKQRVAQMQAACIQEMALLQKRLQDGVNARLLEEFEADKRRLLYALPQEFGALSEVVAQWLSQVFDDSRFDSTEKGSSLRGVYFSSATQTGEEVLAQQASFFARVRNLLGYKAKPAQAVRGSRSFFLTQLFGKVIFREANLVRPNYQWELRYRFLRLMGYLLLAILFLWGLIGMLTSYRNNQNYLNEVAERTAKLERDVTALGKGFKAENTLGVLDAARPLGYMSGLDPADPPMSYLYGLYTVSPVVDASEHTYTSLQSSLLLPAILDRLETVLRQSINAQDYKSTYDTLAVYLMLYDRNHYKAADLRRWVLNDWQNGYLPVSAGSGASTLPPAQALLAASAASGATAALPDGGAAPELVQRTTTGAARFGSKVGFVVHLESMFADDKIVQASSVRDEPLVARARSFLNASSTSQRLYQRTKALLLSQSPPDFTVVTAVGPQAATVFKRANGAPLEKGVPGFFTYDGYHKVFAAKVGEIIQTARQDDSWVMGLQDNALGKAQAEIKALTLSDPLVEDVRRQYLTEYAQQWTAFLDSIRPLTGDNLAFDLNVIRQLAAPDSPLSRLARAAAKETTLSRPLVAAQKPAEDASLIDQATTQIDKKIADTKRSLGMRPEAMMERQIVDNSFGALREIVTGKVEIGGVEAGAAISSKTGLENINALVSEYYTTLVVADTSIASNNAPTINVDANTKLRLEAGKLPAPFKEVLLAIAQSGSEKIERGASEILKKQAQVELDKISMGFANQVQEICRKGIEGRYPFAASTQEVTIEDFNALFSAGGILESYFNKELLPYVDTSTKPWRYKTPEQAAISSTVQTAGSVPAATPSAARGPTLQGELLKLLQQKGPNLNTFAQAQQIREVFFREPGSRKMAWKMDIKVQELDPSITDLYVDIDGQSQHYAHGPVQTLSVSWPGARGGVSAEISANPRIKPETSTIATRGPWALMRLLEKSNVVNTASPGRTVAVYLLDGRKVSLDITTGNQINPMTSDLLRVFKCS